MPVLNRMGIFRNEYDVDGFPVCPSCREVIRVTEPAARSGDSITHLRCLWAVRRPPVARDDQEGADEEMGVFFKAIGRVLQRIRAGMADASNRPAA